VDKRAKVDKLLDYHDVLALNLDGIAFMLIINNLNKVCVMLSGDRQYVSLFNIRLSDKLHRQSFLYVLQLLLLCGTGILANRLLLTLD